MGRYDHFMKKVEEMEVVAEKDSGLTLEVGKAVVYVTSSGEKRSALITGIREGSVELIYVVRDPDKVEMVGKVIVAFFNPQRGEGMTGGFIME